MLELRFSVNKELPEKVCDTSSHPIEVKVRHYQKLGENEFLDKLLQSFLRR
jgi:hypothetical protein